MQRTICESLAAAVIKRISMLGGPDGDHADGAGTAKVSRCKLLDRIPALAPGVKGMSNVVSGTIPKPAGPHDAIRALLRAGRNDEAIVQLCAITVVQPDDLVAQELLFDAFFQKRDWAPALVLAEQLAQHQPGVARLERALIATLSNMKSYDKTTQRPLNISNGTAKT